MFAEDIISDSSVELSCSYTRFNSADGGVALNVLNNAAVVVRGKARLTEFVSLPTAFISRLGPSSPPRAMVTHWQSLSMSTPPDSDGDVRLIGQIDNQIFKPDVEVGAGGVVIKNEDEISSIVAAMLGSIYAIDMQGKNGFFVQNAVGPPFGGKCPVRQPV